MDLRNPPFRGKLVSIYRRHAFLQNAGGENHWCSLKLRSGGLFKHTKRLSRRTGLLKRAIEELPYDDEMRRLQ
jgi:hypothetical protein